MTSSCGDKLEGEGHVRRVERIAAATETFFRRGMPGVDIQRIAAFAADMMAAELTGETYAARQPLSQGSSNVIR